MSKQLAHTHRLLLCFCSKRCAKLLVLATTLESQVEVTADTRTTYMAPRPLANILLALGSDLWGLIRGVRAVVQHVAVVRR